MRSFPALAVSLFCAAAVPAVGADKLPPIVGAPTTTDGDTVRIGEARIRLFGIDAPEGKQTCEREGVTWLCGQESAKWLREFVGEIPLTCTPKNRDRYGRTVAICTLPDGRDIGAESIRAGMALAYRQYGGALYDQPEKEAREARRGLWGGKFTPPWSWRRGGGSRAQ